MMDTKLIFLTSALFCFFTQINTEGPVDVLSNVKSKSGTRIPPKISLKDVEHDKVRFVVVSDWCRTENDEEALVETTFIITVAKFNTQEEDRLYDQSARDDASRQYKFYKSGLSPNTNYTILLHGCNERAPQQEIFTTLCQPLDISVDPGYETAKVTFKLENSSTLSHYNFALSTNAPDDSIEQWQSGDTIIKLRNLTPDTEYTFEARHKKETKCSSGPKNFRTKPNNAGRIVYVKLVDKTNNITKQTLNWTINENKGTITSIALDWKYQHLACPYTNSSGTTLQSDFNTTEIFLLPYTRYKFLNIVIQFGSSSESKPQKEQQINFTPFSRENFSRKEIPVITNVTVYEEWARVFFEELNCETMEGPIFLNYQSDSSEYECESIPLAGNGQPFPFQTKFRTIHKLTPYCTYNITIYISRKAYMWENATIVYTLAIKTDPCVIAKPLDELTVTSKGQDHVQLRWKLNSKPNGFVTYYSIAIRRNTIDRDYNATINGTVKRCPLWPEYFCHNVNITYLEAATDIDILVIGVNHNNLSTLGLQEAIANAKSMRRNYSKTVYTNETVPEQPYEVEAEWSTDHPIYAMNVSWKHPNSTNGILKYFQISIIISSSGRYLEGTEARYSIRSTDDYKLKYYEEVDFSHKYGKKWDSVKVSVNATNSAATSPYSDYFTMQHPPSPKGYNIAGRINITDLILHVPKPADPEPFFEKMVIFKADKDDVVNSEVDTIHSSLANNVNELKINETTQTYRLIYTYSRNDTIFNRSIKIDDGLFKNKRQYIIAIFIVNELNGRRTVKHAKKIVSANSEQVEEEKHAIIPIVLVLSFLLPVMAFLTYRYRHKFHLLKGSFGNAFQRNSHADDITPLTFIEGDYAEPSTSRDESNEGTNFIAPILPIRPIHSKRVKVDNFGKYVQKCLKNEEFQKQHQLFPRSDELIQKDNRFTCNYGSLPENRPKNRYHKIIPYDHTLVKLNEIPGDEYSDYINANYINGHKLSKAYIATQGPTKNTLNDFWRMICEQNVTSIVMLSNFNQESKKECEVYWPEINDEQKDYNGIVIELVEIKRHPTYDVRDFNVHFDFETRRVKQVHFKAWPAIGQPLYPQTLVPLLQKILTLPYTKRSPIVVHCSAGIGRTGTIILCDICLRMAAAEGAVDVLGTLERLRSQRPNMVDNVEQYKLAHLAILACWTDWNTCVPCDGNFQTSLEGLLEDGIVRLNMEYLKESEWQDDAMKVATVSGQALIVPEKNRHRNIVPDEQFQIFLEILPGQDDSSAYINAIRVNSFRVPDRYIVTQQPLPTTMGDFWRMVVEQRCTVVINLNAVTVDDATSVQFWPENESSMALQEGLAIRHVKTLNAREYSLVTVKASYCPNEFEKTKLTVEILTFTNWQSHQEIPENMDDFVSFVEDWSAITRKSHPVIVTCHDGATASGFYVAMANLIEEMKLEKQCDICKTVRAIRNCRKQFVDKEIQLGFLYNAAIFYLNNFGVYQDLEYFTDI